MGARDLLQYKDHLPGYLDLLDKDRFVMRLSCLVFIMEIPIIVRWCLYIEMAPRNLYFTSEGADILITLEDFMTSHTLWVLRWMIMNNENCRMRKNSQKCEPYKLVHLLLHPGHSPGECWCTDVSSDVAVWALMLPWGEWLQPPGPIDHPSQHPCG